EGGSAAFNPFVLPLESFSSNWGPEVLLLIFFVNWSLTLLNLLPIYPLDGGRMLEACLIGRGTAHERKTLCLKVGTVSVIVLLALGLMLDNTYVVVLGSIVLVLNVLEGVSLQWNE